MSEYKPTSASGSKDNPSLAGFTGERRDERPARFTRIMECCSARDRLWFERHPDEPAYIRIQVPGEFWPMKAGHGDLTLVKCFRDPIEGTQLARERSAVLALRDVCAAIDGGRMKLLKLDGTIEYESVATEGVAR